MTDEGRIILQAIKDGTAIAVSDGSYRDMHGTAAWVIEGIDHQGQITGKAIAPGGSETQSLYCSKLTGIYANMVVVHNICSFYTINESTTEFACNRLLALDRASPMYH
jgi:hypothetical protein